MSPDFFEPDAAYRITLTRDVPAGAIVLRAGSPVQLRGDYCAKLAENIASAEKIEE
jgi:hypothetical protein